MRFDDSEMLTPPRSMDGSETSKGTHRIKPSIKRRGTIAPDTEGEKMYEDGGVYKGQMKGDLREGQGTMVFPNGDRYVGQWRDDKMDGTGTFFISKGGQYDGQW